MQKKIRLVYLVPTIKLSLAKKNPDIADLQVEIIALKEFVLSEVCLLKKEAKGHLKLQQSNAIPLKNNYKIFDANNNEILITDSNVDKNNKKRRQKNNGKVHLKESAKNLSSAKIITCDRNYL